MPVIMLGGSPPGSPPDAIANLVWWIKADAGVYKDAGTTLAADGETVQQWNDQSVSAHHISQPTAGNRPVYTANGVNGRPVVRFDATDDFMLRSANTDDDLITNNAMTIFIVWKPPSSVNIQRVLQFSDGVNNVIFAQNGSNTVLQNRHYDGTEDFVNSGALTLGAWFIQTWHHASGNLYIGANDTRDASLSSAASGNTSFGANTNIAIRIVPVTAVQTDIAEIAIYNAALSEADRKSVETYLAWKYGITLPY